MVDHHNVRDRPVSSVRDANYSNLLCLTEAELEMIDQDLEHAQKLEIGSRSEIAVLSALTKRLDAIDTEGCLALFDMIDVDRNGFLTMAELERGVRRREVSEFISKTRNVTLKGLRKVDRFAKVFSMMDKSDSGVLTKADFASFVRAIALERIRFMRVAGLLYGRCYWGLGLKEETKFFPRGYCADWKFYVANNHPYLALFMRDEAHPYSKRDALCAELIKQAYCLSASVVIDPWEKSWSTTDGALHNWKLSLLAISIPVMLLEHLLFLLLACPCLRFERRGRRRETCLQRLETGCGCIGHAIVWPLALAATALVFFAVYKLISNPDAHATFALLWIAGLLSEYLLTWPILKLLVQFNLWFPTQHKRESWLTWFCCCCCGLWKFLGCGKWANERRTATQLAIQDAGDEDYYEYFAGPPRTNAGSCRCCCCWYV